MRRVLTAVAVAGMLATGCGGNTGKDIGAKDSSPTAPTTSAAPDTFDVAGTIALIGEGYGGAGGCEGSEGYGDMRVGTQVTIYNATGTPIALGDLGDGRNHNGDCVFTFAVPAVPAQEGSDIYSVEVSHRGQIQFTRAEASTLAFSLGN